ncbi:ABC-type amino acid transport system, permease protein [Desulforapulum autotrophicum HRM2]|uniref:ABC-type amino acid transport system, permease protein n=1 Tax=Desulforapulum autotrophicum (strain ATCC 43914 / DSM 3382 / VKM B-1955 / HRM2) TaxID=177437 RepID=C0QCC6_DESAH|nr:amino acid ABC transporter permease [Desulforapulum autotrophicum]ACN17143.1 ABC-type amino acid transport system, permease protein [Desulforapulum autotrophicum HRM2]
MIQQPPRLKLFDLLIFALVAAGLAWLMGAITAQSHYNWQWEVIPQYLLRLDDATQKWVPGMILTGLFITLRISFWATLSALVIGTIMGAMKSGRSHYLKMVATAYVETIRNIPVIVWIFIFYYFLGDIIVPLTGLDRAVNMNEGLLRQFLTTFVSDPSLLPVFFSATASLALYEGAYFTEIIRAGIESIEKGQWEASSSLGFTRFQQLRHVILPQALRRMLPPMAGQIISTIKDSSIVSVISIQELTFQGMELMSATFLTFEVWLTILALYFIVCFCCSMGVAAVERRLTQNM